MGPAESQSKIEAQPLPGVPEVSSVPAWEEVAAGRYMPRRIRGSCHGRELG